VKGSVELAPLTGLVEGIVDLTATGTTLRENGLVVREEIALCTARLIANPVAHKLRAAPIDDLLEVVDSKYRLVIMAAKRARQINAYYAQLGEGLLEYVGPLVETRVQEKPLSIALREIRQGMLTAVETAES